MLLFVSARQQRSALCNIEQARKDRLARLARHIYKRDYMLLSMLALR